MPKTTIRLLEFLGAEIPEPFRTAFFGVFQKQVDIHEVEFEIHHIPFRTVPLQGGFDIEDAVETRQQIEGLRELLGEQMNDFVGLHRPIAGNESFVVVGTLISPDTGVSCNLDDAFSTGQLDEDFVIEKIDALAGTGRCLVTMIFVLYAPGKSDPFYTIVLQQYTSFKHTFSSRELFDSENFDPVSHLLDPIIPEVGLLESFQNALITYYLR
jgi:hypothetical protein